MIDKDYHFEILPNEGTGDGVPFGIGLDVSLDAEGFAPGSTDWAVQDAEDPSSGVTMFGRDRLLGPVWNWQLHVNRTDADEAIETLGVFKTAWRALHIRNTPGAVVALRYRVGGRTRRIYGRPRRFEAPPTNQILSGYVPVSVDFKCVDDFTYEDQETTVTLSLGEDLEDPTQDTGGGFIFPVTFPVATLPPTRERIQVSVGGDAPTYPIVRFNGPVVDPRLVTDDWTLSLGYTIPAGQYVEIDTRPWRQTVMLNGATSVAGRLGRRQRLSKVYFNPGRFEAKYVGFSSSSSTCVVRWAAAHNSL